MAGLTTGGGLLLSCIRVVDLGGVNSVRVGSSRGGGKRNSERNDTAGEGAKKKQKVEADVVDEEM
jgi:hypothetical protein